MTHEIFVQMGKLAGYWTMHQQVLELFKSYMKLNYKSSVIIESPCNLKNIYIFLLFNFSFKSKILGQRR